MLSKSIAPRRAALAALMITLNLAALSATASAKTLAGVWAPFNRCPVDSVAMLEANGESAIAACAAMEAPTGSLTIGHFSTSFNADGSLGLGWVRVAPGLHSSATGTRRKPLSRAT